MSKIDFAEGGECLPSEMNVPPRNDKTCFHRLIAQYTDGIGDGAYADGIGDSTYADGIGDGTYVDGIGDGTYAVAK